MQPNMEDQLHFMIENDDVAGAVASGALSAQFATKTNIRHCSYTNHFTLLPYYRLLMNCGFRHTRSQFIQQLFFLCSLFLSANVLFPWKLHIYLEFNDIFGSKLCLNSNFEFSTILSAEITYQKYEWCIGTVPSWIPSNRKKFTLFLEIFLKISLDKNWIQKIFFFFSFLFFRQFIGQFELDHWNKIENSTVAWQCFWLWFFYTFAIFLYSQWKRRQIILFILSLWQ